jgi:ABC-type branched-subunit amino acid transport system ATPase component
MSSALLETRGLTRRFGGFVANSDVSIALEPGEIRGLIGPNGAGKTTLVNMITGVLPPSAGEVLLDGERLVGLAPHEIARRGLLRSFQVSRLFGNLTVHENLLLPYYARGQGEGEAAERAAAFLDVTKLARLAAAPAKSLSGGQRALLQVACGFMVPELRCYVLDEPFAGINPVIKDTIVDLILEENRRRRIGFLVVSHEMAVVRRLCSKVTVLIEGRVMAEGPLDQVAARPEVISAYLGKALA